MMLLEVYRYRRRAAMLGGLPPPEAGDETGPDAVRTKEEIRHYLTGSFAYLHRAAAAIDPSAATARSMISFRTSSIGVTSINGTCR